MNELTTTALLLVILGLLMAASVVASRLIDRLGVPIVLLFLVLGMLGGSEGIGGIPFEDYRFAFRLGTVALILILLDGGINTPFSSIRESIAPAAVLATVGVAGVAGLTALFAHWMGLPWSESLLLGAVVSSTDAAMVFAVLRGGGIRLTRRVGATLEVEAGANDPMAVILTLAVTSMLAGETTDRVQMAWSVPLQLAIGAGVGIVLGWGSRLLLQNVRFPTAGFYPVLTLALSIFVFGLATLTNGSGFLAVYVFGTVVGNSLIPYRSGLVRVHDAIAWLCQVSMFLMLGVLIFPSQLRLVAGVGIGIALFLAFIARPLVALLCLLPFGYPWREILYIGWVGLRGAVPIILATFPVLAGVEGAMRVFNIVFFIVVFSALIPGATIRFVTRRLGLEAPETPSPLAALEITSTRLLDGELLSFHVTEPLAVCNVPIAKIPFPPHSSAVLVVRGEELVAPRGSTVLQPEDHVYIFCRSNDKPFIELLFGRSHEHI
jgi:cell volume regulation protein A